MKDQKKIEITPVFLAGGLGSRLWPLSRKSYPKQFSNLIGENSMFQESISRFSSSEILSFSSLSALPLNFASVLQEVMLSEKGHQGSMKSVMQALKGEQESNMTALKRPA